MCVVNANMNVWGIWHTKVSHYSISLAEKNVSKERSHMVRRKGRVGLVSCSTRWYLVGVEDPLKTEVNRRDFYDQGGGGGGVCEKIRIENLVTAQTWSCWVGSYPARQRDPIRISRRFFSWFSSRAGAEQSFVEFAAQNFPRMKKTGKKKGETARLCVWLWQFCNNKAYLTLEEGWGSK